MKLSQLEKLIQPTLTNSKDIIQKAESSCFQVAGPDQRAAKQMRPGARFSKAPIINGAVKLLLFTCKIGVLIVLHLT